MSSILLLNCSQTFNKFELEAKDIFAFFLALICGLSRKTDSYRGQLQRRITLSRLIVDIKSYLYMNKSRLLCIPVKSNNQVLKILRPFS